MSLKIKLLNLHFVSLLVSPMLQLNSKAETDFTLKGPFEFVGLFSTVEQMISVSPAYNVHNVFISVLSLVEIKLKTFENVAE